MVSEKEYNLVHIDDSAASQAIDIVTNSPWLLSALKYNGLNYVYSERILKNLFSSDAHKMFMVNESGSGSTVAVIGLRDVDLIQKRAQLILLHEKSKDKKLYKPIKKLLERAFTQWSLNTLTTVLYTDNVYHRPMLKGFGFTSAGVIKEFTEYENELYDVEIFSLQKKYFNSIKD